MEVCSADSILFASQAISVQRTFILRQGFSPPNRVAGVFEEEDGTGRCPEGRGGDGGVIRFVLTIKGTKSTKV